MNKLTIELVPKSLHYKNLRSCLEPAEWDILRRNCYLEAQYKCKICGEKGKHHPVECHEIWEYNDEQHIQKLLGLIAICPDCHRVKHAGLASLQGKIKQVYAQLMKVNQISYAEAIMMIREAAIQWIERNQYVWTTDYSKLEELTRSEEN